MKHPPAQTGPHDLKSEEQPADIDSQNVPPAEQADEGGDPVEQVREERKGQSKSDFYKLYKNKGPHVMYADILADPCLRAAAEILVHVTRPLHAQYQCDLQAQQQGEATLLEWNANRSLGSTYGPVADILKACVSAKLYKQMRLTDPCKPPLAFDASALEEDCMLLQKAFDFGVELAGNYAWSEMLHRLTLPLAAGSLLAMSIESKKRGLKHLKTMVEAIVKAEDMEATNPSLTACLRDVAFVEEPFARELMINLRKGRYDVTNAHVLEAMRAMLRFTNGSSSTKEILESTFGHLAHVVGKHSTNKSISPSGVWFYSTSSPFIKPSGMEQEIPSNADWSMRLGSFGISSDETYKEFCKAFKPNGTDLPSAPDLQLPRNVQGIVKTEWRLAGPASHYKASAACALLMRDSAEDFRNVPTAWAGRLDLNRDFV